jgi:general stress protein YciG
MGIEKRGFASMDRERLKELSGHGGRKAHAVGRAHKWTREEARQAGLRSVAQRRLRKALREQEAAPVDGDAPAATDPATTEPSTVAR